MVAVLSVLVIVVCCFLEQRTWNVEKRVNVESRQ